MRLSGGSSGEVWGLRLLSQLLRAAVSGGSGGELREHTLQPPSSLKWQRRRAVGAAPAVAAVASGGELRLLSRAACLT